MSSPRVTMIAPQTCQPPTCEQLVWFGEQVVVWLKGETKVLELYQDPHNKQVYLKHIGPSYNDVRWSTLTYMEGDLT